MLEALTDAIMTTSRWATCSLGKTVICGRAELHGRRKHASRNLMRCKCCVAAATASARRHQNGNKHAHNGAHARHVDIGTNFATRGPSGHQRQVQTVEHAVNRMQHVGHSVTTESIANHIDGDNTASKRAGGVHQRRHCQFRDGGGQEGVMDLKERKKKERKKQSHKHPHMRTDEKRWRGGNCGAPTVYTVGFAGSVAAWRPSTHGKIFPMQADVPSGSTTSTGDTSLRACWGRVQNCSSIASPSRSEAARASATSASWMTVLSITSFRVFTIASCRSTNSDCLYITPARER